MYFINTISIMQCCPLYRSRMILFELKNAPSGCTGEPACAAAQFGGTTVQQMCRSNAACLDRWPPAVILDGGKAWRTVAYCASGTRYGRSLAKLANLCAADWVEPMHSIPGWRRYTSQLFCRDVCGFSHQFYNAKIFLSLYN